MPAKKRSVRKPDKKGPLAVDETQRRKTALITGASSGIGYDLSSLFAENGYDLVLVARTRGKLLALANQVEMFGVSATVIEQDLAVPGAAEQIVRKIEKKGIRIDVLVNNAGYGNLGMFAFSEMKSELEMIQVNIVAMAHLTKLILPEMIKRQDGRILNVGSIAGFRPGPLMTNYAASKAWVLSFSTALAEELRGSGVTVTALCPGPTFTGFQERAGMTETRLQRMMMSDSRTVARAGFEGLMAGRTILVPGFFNRVAAFLSKIAPATVSARLTRRMYEETFKPIILKTP